MAQDSRGNLIGYDPTSLLAIQVEALASLVAKLASDMNAKISAFNTKIDAVAALAAAGGGVSGGTDVSANLSTDFRAAVQDKKGNADGALALSASRFA